MSYLPPVFLEDANVFRAAPFNSPLGMPLPLPGSGVTTLEMSGYRFGDPALAIPQRWSSDDQFIGARINGQPCVNVSNSLVPGAPPGPRGPCPLRPGRLRFMRFRGPFGPRRSSWPGPPASAQRAS